MNEHENHKEPSCSTVCDQNRVLEGKVALGESMLCGCHAALERKWERKAAARAPQTAPTQQSDLKTKEERQPFWLTQVRQGSGSPQLRLKEAQPSTYTSSDKRRDSRVPLNWSGHTWEELREAGRFKAMVIEKQEYKAIFHTNISNLLPRNTCARSISMGLCLVDNFAVWNDSGECFYLLLWIWKHEVFPVFLLSRSTGHKSMNWMLKLKGKRKELTHQMVTNWNNLLSQLARAVAFFCQSPWAHLEN